MKHTPLETDFQGLTHAPSDYSSMDGELATCLNLIPENGELHIISSPKEEETFTLPESSKIVFVHKVTHNETLHTHYIIQDGDNIYWLEKGASSYDPTQIYQGKVNSVTAIGNILCFVEDSSTKYAYWKTDRYIVFNLQDINYTIEVNDTMGQDGGIAQDNGSIFGISTILSDEEWQQAFPDYSTTTTSMTPGASAKAANIVFNAFDALVNKRMSELGDEWFKYLSFGVVALRLYDGTYINISNPFVLAPNVISNKFLYLKSKKTITTRGYLHKHTIRLNLELLDGMEDIIVGATVFLTSPESFIDTDIAPLQIGNNYNPYYNDKMVSDTCSAAFYFKTKKSMYDMIDSMQYYKSIDIDIDEFGKDIQLKSISQTNESLSLADMGRMSWGGKNAITYNNRLHIANVRKSIVNAFESYPFNVLKLAKDYSFNMDAPGCYLNTHVENIGMLEKSCVADAVFEVSLGDTILKKSMYYKGKIQYPISPIISFPDTSASRLTMYLNVKGINKCYKVEMPLHKSNTFGMSYYVYLGDRAMGGKLLFGGKEVLLKAYSNYGYDNLGLPQFMQYEKFKLSETNGTVSWSKDGNNDLFTLISEEEYNEALKKVDGNMQSTETYPSVIKVSEAENPLVFPAKNTVQVGSSVINGIAANTRPITEGQFGDAPLYAFTDEGVWVLMLGSYSEGTYQARQPVNRYICTDPGGILQIDDAVVYPTEQGIMIQDGNKTTCITDVLDGRGVPFWLTSIPQGASILNCVKAKPESVQYCYFRDYLKESSMIYDYYNGRIILFNKNYDYAYVYSLRSKLWGAMANNLKSRVNIYPEAYAIDRDNKIVNLYNPSTDNSETYVLCTRPISFGTKSFKTIFDLMVNGFFPKRKDGKCGIALYGSNNLERWYLIGSGIYPRLQLLGSPYKYFRIALVGNLSANESIVGLSSDIQERWQNSLR